MVRECNLSIKSVFYCCLTLGLFAQSGASAAGKLAMLHAFTGSDGALPSTGVIMDDAGNIFGTASGGVVSRDECPLGCGVIFKLAPDGTETVLYTFQGKADGAFPSGLLADGKGNFYGAVEAGTCSASGCGAVFEFTSHGKEKVLYNFQGGADGSLPNSAVVRDSAGNLYGTTLYGGGTGCQNNFGCGTVYKLAPDGTETVLHAFQGTDGGWPTGGLVMDKAGNLYGTTEYGGANDGGVVFKIDSKGSESTVYTFCEPDCAAGSNPNGGLAIDGSGNLYGTSEFGGANQSGNIFKVAPDGTYTVLYDFTMGPWDIVPSGVVIGKGGNLYGVTKFGGRGHKRCCGDGTVYKLAPDGTETVLSYLKCAHNGCFPLGPLLLDRAGNLYGTASNGGPVSCPEGDKTPGCGTIFEIKN